MLGKGPGVLLQDSNPGGTNEFSEDKGQGLGKTRIQRKSSSRVEKRRGDKYRLCCVGILRALERSIEENVSLCGAGRQL